ncbi:MAG: tRNA threonylcarbamoyladenosine dehydratase [Alphaproteobacteria bacterium]|nr:tRNA threonylcarbamoyladenosine dehydratase [Alphaproteobacteria bacterium]
MTISDQYTRLRLLLGDERLEKLQNNFVIIAGLGAVGSYTTEALARCGIKKMRLIDHDTVSLSNINRQLYALHSTLGCPKAEIAKQRVLDINPNCEVEIIQGFINKDTVSEYMSGSPNFVVDAIDSLNPKAELIAFLRENNVPFISAMGAALRTDPRFIQTGTMNQVNHCRLAFMLRKRLRKRNVPLDFPCVFSTQPLDNIPTPVYPEHSELTPGLGRERTVMGSLPTITGIFGLLLANFVIQNLSGKLFQ